MDLLQLSIFTNQIKDLIEQNQELTLTISSLNEKVENQSLKITEYEDKEKTHFSQLKEVENNYINEVKSLKDKIESLKKENSEKSSKTIWETTQHKIKEKDELIEELKKAIEFYKRTQTVLIGNSADVKEVKSVKPENKEIQKVVPEIKPEIHKIEEVKLEIQKVEEVMPEKQEIKEVKPKKKTKLVSKAQEIKNEEDITKVKNSKMYYNNK